MKKTDLKEGLQFKGPYSSDTIYTVELSYDKKSYYVTSKIVLKSGYEIQDNQYTIKSITDKYLTFSTFVISKPVTIKVPLKDIVIINQ